MHVLAINEDIKGLPAVMIGVHYCSGNYSSSCLTAPDYSGVLLELLTLKVSTLVGEIANPMRAGEPSIIKNYVKEYG